MVGVEGSGFRTFVALTLDFRVCDFTSTCIPWGLAVHFTQKAYNNCFDPSIQRTSGVATWRGLCKNRVGSLPVDYRYEEISFS